MKKYGILQRTISLLLSLVLVASCLPAGLLTDANAATGVSGVVSAEQTADISTLNAWADTAFNPYELTTEHAGGIWTDKTVLKGSDVATALPGISGIDVADGNFLVALSALGANSVIAGQSTTPTDTIFVLDVSNSMENDDLDAMVSATNDSIHTLLQANPDNRIGVVVYATNVTVLLELDRYTPVEKTSWNTTETAYIEMASNYGQIRTARNTTQSGWWGSEEIEDIVKNSAGQDVTTSVSASGATYIQGGLWQAYQMFQNATVTDTRTPVLVLMSDGAPTYGNSNYNNVTTGSRNVGDGSSSSVTDGLAFLTQLTAAYVKEKIADKYGVASYFYSVGLNISEGNTVSIAEAVLDTGKTRTAIENNWTNYLALANAQNNTMRFSAAGSNVTVTYDAAITADSKSYTDKYMSADDASQLQSAFEGIVNEINLKASYNVTRIDGADANTGGYVTFVDEIGTGMEVKDIKGILIGNQLFSGAQLAQAMKDGAFGTEAAPTALGNNLVWSITERMRIAGSATETAEEIVWGLVEDAKNAGQIYYNSAADYSNLIAWFGDANGSFLGFWDVAEENPVIPEGAVYANMCYGMLGATTGSQTAHASDMMYVAIQVSKKITDGKILANTPQIVTFRVPASLLPTVTYQIDVDVATDEEITENTNASITYNPAEPIRLLYEVGVHSQLTPLNVKEFLRDGYEAMDDEGNYYLYTNAWYWEPDSGLADFDNPPTKENAIGKEVLYDTSKNHITYAYFEPSAENEHYYFTEDTALYIQNGATYQKLTAAPVTDGSVQYYFQHKVFTANATGTGTAVDAQVDIHYGPVSQKLLQNAANIGQDDAGVYYIKQGTMHYETIHNHDKVKTENKTGSFGYRMHQLVDIAVNSDTSHHYEITYLGNNGRITYAPAQGLKISKVMNDGSQPDAQFTFDVSLSAPAGAYSTVHVAANGTETSGTVAVDANGDATVSLKPGESIYILDLPANTTYTVTEQALHGYRLVSAAQNTGVIANNIVSEAVFTNMVQQYSSLTVSKWATYEDGVAPTADNNEFDVTVSLAEENASFSGTVYVDSQAYTVTDGTVTFKIKHGQQVVISDIPVGIYYEVVEDETALPAGYTWANKGAASLSGAIDADGQYAELLNTYDPAPVEIGQDNTLNITFRKKLDYRYNDPNGPYDFSFALRRYNPETGEWEVIDIRDISFASLVPNMDNYALDLTLSANGEILSTAGVHYFRLEEVPGSIPGMIYDRTLHDFKVVITDSDLDGKLEIADVEPVDETVTVTDGSANEWTVSTQFNNIFSADDTGLTIQAKKTLTNTHTNENVLKDGQFEFALFETDNTFDITGKTPIAVKNGANGDVVFPAVSYRYSDGAQSYYYVMKELSGSGNGVTVDSTVWEIQVDVGVVSNAAVVNTVQWRKQGETAWNNQVSSPANNLFNEIVFENTYTPAEVTYQVEAEKTLTNLTPGVAQQEMTVPGSTYSFTLDRVTANAPLPGQTTVSAAQGGSITFPEITFNAAGTYVYTLTENDTTVPGVTKDASVYTVEITVTDDGAGQLAASAVYLKDSAHVDEAVFNNTYKAAPTGDVVLGGGKALTVAAGSQRDLQPGEFFFTLTKPDGSTETVSNTENGGTRFKFSPITFDTVGHYTFTIREVIPHGAENNTLHGITYAPVPLTVPIEIYDDGSGVLKAKMPTGELNTQGSLNYVSHFNNAYKAAPDTVRLTAHKDLVGRELRAGEFTFKLTPVAGAPMPANYADATNDEYGSVDFGEITFDSVGTYTYTVTEDHAGDTIDGVTYSQKVYTVTVNVQDNGNGKLVAHVSSADEGGAAQPGGVVFTNTYKAASVTVHVEGDSAATDGKIFADESSLPENKKDLDDFAFRFTLYEVGGEEVQTVEDNGQGFSFDPMEFTEAGIYQYLIYERPDNAPGVIYDSAKYRVTVTVTDNGLGQLEADVVYEKAESGESSNYQTVQGILFQNSYKAKETSVIFSGKKTLTGRDLQNKEFTFILKDAASGEKIAEVTHDETGAFSFLPVTYTGEGVYTYILEEKNDGKTGITYDTAKYTLTVTVADVNGELKATTDIKKDGAAADTLIFANVFTPEETPNGEGSEPGILEPEKEPEKTPEKEPEKTPEIDSPQTGDTFHLGAWTLLLSVSAMGMLAVLLLGKKKEDSIQ